MSITLGRYNKVGMDAKEAFAKGDEDRDVEKGIRGQLVELNPIYKKDATEEFMDGNGKTTDNKIDEGYPKT
jgi:hypothetical protein